MDHSAKLLDGLTSVHRLLAESKQEGFGMSLHMLIDGYGANKETLSSRVAVEGMLRDLPGALNMKVIYGPVAIHYTGSSPLDWGISGFVIIAESHISIHTFPERGSYWADVFSCLGFDADRIADYFRALFGGDLTYELHARPLPEVSYA